MIEIDLLYLDYYYYWIWECLMVYFYTLNLFDYFWLVDTFVFCTAGDRAYLSSLTIYYDIVYTCTYLLWHVHEYIIGILITIERDLPLSLRFIFSLIMALMMTLLHSKSAEIFYIWNLINYRIGVIAETS